MQKNTKITDLKILIVDDDPPILKLISRFLHNLGVRFITTAGNGNEGLVILDSGEAQYDIVLCDLNMPEMDGIHFLRCLADRNFPGGLAFLSGEDERMLETAFELAKACKMNCLGTISKTQLNQDILLDILDNFGSLEALSPSTRPKLITEEEFRSGLANDAIDLYYQPKVMVSNGNICGVEALARWKHDQRGILSPICFISVAEDIGMIDALTYKVYKIAIKQLADWRRQGMDLDMSINVSINTFSTPDFPAYLVNTARDYAVDHTKIILEITESEAMADAITCLEILMHLRMKRFGLSVDDFGTGHSSLTKLKQIPFTELKIDRTFVNDAINKPSSRAILESSVELARKFKMKIVAEGVETREDWNLVKELGCDYAQGYYCARPMPGNKLAGFIQKTPLPV
jgi:EAL domain-containing protein (putative c-di-GMP-specific phosphodiesterase class I)/ActR/RegA family two-component response regulator